MSDFWTQAIAAHDHALVLSLVASGLRLDEARDVAQEAWLRIIESVAAGRLDRVELPGLVIRQASFIVVDRQRARSLRSLVPVHEAEALAAPESSEDVTQARELLEVLNAGMSGATARERGVLQQVLTSDDGHRTLAAREGVSLQRFRQALCDVRAKLRRALEQP